jgi:NADP-dependent 3-hydroxy acid dehydrogenase YdfG
VPVAMVTGAGRGIGKATAIALAEAGFSVGLVGRRGRQELEQTDAEVAERGMDQLVAVVDVTDRHSVHQAIIGYPDAPLEYGCAREQRRVDGCDRTYLGS